LWFAPFLWMGMMVGRLDRVRVRIQNSTNETDTKE